MHRIIAFIFAFTASLPFAAADSAWKWEMLPSESTLTFHGSQMGQPFAGNFSTFAPEIYFNPAHPEQAHVTVVIDTASATTKNADWDKTLLGKDWLATAVFPVARFESRSFVQKGERSYEVDGTLTIRDAIIPVAFPFELTFTKDDSGKEKALMRADFALDRSKLGLGKGEWEDPGIIANEVRMEITLSAFKVQ